MSLLDRQEFAPFRTAQSISENFINALKLPILTKSFLTLGGGIGSFVWVDYLRVHGVNTADIGVLGIYEEPYQRYQTLCRNSQIPGYERLRSDSGSTPDNIWGWPGYGIREVASLTRQGHLRSASSRLWQLFNEPVFTQTYTPQSQQVYAAMDREAERIGWNEMWQYGRIRSLRKTDAGRYCVLYEDRHGNPKIALANVIHIALGYPGFRFLPDLQTYREATLDLRKVVNAYEMHDHVYEFLAEHGGTVMLRGRGIVASRILQRIAEVRTASGRDDIRVVHLMRTARDEDTRYGLARRKSEHNWQLQPFNFPKAAFSGNLRRKFQNATDEERRKLISIWGGTTTSDRTDWKHLVQNGLTQGWYKIAFGNVLDVKPMQSGKLRFAVESIEETAEQLSLVSDFVIDCTGLNAKIETNPFYDDLLTHYQIPKNAMQNLAVSETFEIEALRAGRGRVYACGVATLGGPFAPVDSFLGLQYAAFKSLQGLRSAREFGLKRFSMPRSLYQWMRWARGVQP